jgi:hypothetical protein
MGLKERRWQNICTHQSAFIEFNPKPEPGPYQNVPAMPAMPLFREHEDSRYYLNTIIYSLASRSYHTANFLIVEQCRNSVNTPTQASLVSSCQYARANDAKTTEQPPNARHKNSRRIPHSNYNITNTAAMSPHHPNTYDLLIGPLAPLTLPAVTVVPLGAV